MVKDIDDDFVIQGKYANGKQGKASDSEKNNTNRVSGQTGNEENHTSNGHREYTPDEEVYTLA